MKKTYKIMLFSLAIVTVFLTPLHLLAQKYPFVKQKNKNPFNAPKVNQERVELWRKLDGRLPKPDLQIHAVHFRQEQLVEGWLSIGVGVIFVNRGQAEVQGNWTAKAELLGEGIVQPYFGEARVEAFIVNQHPDAMAAVPVLIRLNQPIMAGRYNVKVMLDSHSEIDEISEDNNERTVDIVVRG